MEDASWQLLLGPYGLTAAALLAVAALTRAALHLHRINQELHQKRVNDQEKYLALVESQQEHHLEAQRIITRGALIMERVERHLEQRAGS